MAKDRVEEKELVEKERGEYEAARFGFQRVRQENDGLKRDLTACQTQLADQQDHDERLEKDLRQSRLEVKSFQKRLTTSQREVDSLKQDLSNRKAELNTQQDRSTTLEAELKSLRLGAEGPQRRIKILEDEAKHARKSHEEKVALLEAELDEARQKSNSLSVGPNGDHGRASATFNDIQAQDGMSDRIASHDEEDTKSKSSETVIFQVWEQLLLNSWLADEEEGRQTG
ncbi:hypothetical protein FSARC_8006 [Fusarium sarcochroum]|uniref:Uncharacterized protein n=1 Tax=Fusarium sarcochroum TaxID=1208366 RepID=A0A8H4TU33_9HYPO|nr:hypothetical protein FSARC_8006 [Fusarium sarcochroum]